MVFPISIDSNYKAGAESKMRPGSNEFTANTFATSQGGTVLQDNMSELRSGGSGSNSMLYLGSPVATQNKSKQFM